MGMNTNKHPHPNGDLINTGQPWITEAVAQQEEDLRRSRSCTGGSGKTRPMIGLAHSWDRFSPAPGHKIYEACWRCGVTRTDEDYQRKLAPKKSSEPRGSRVPCGSLRAILTQGSDTRQRNRRKFPRPL